MENENIDLFEHYVNLPSEVLEIIDRFYESENDYICCSNLVDELEKVGYTCEYGLDAEPYGLKKL